MDGIKTRIVVVNARQYDMVSREDGRRLSGTSIRYVFGDGLEPVIDGDFKGYSLSKATLPFNDFTDRLIEVPGVYDAVLSFNVNKDGQAVASINSILFSHSLFQQPVVTEKAAEKGGK